MAKKKGSKSETPVEEVAAPEATEESAGPDSYQLPDGSLTEDKDKYSKEWLALGGGLCHLMGDDVKMHSFDPFVAVVWKGQVLLQLPPDFVETLVHKYTQVLWENHNFRTEKDQAQQAELEAE